MSLSRGAGQHLIASKSRQVGRPKSDWHMAVTTSTCNWNWHGPCSPKDGRDRAVVSPTLWKPVARVPRRREQVGRRRTFSMIHKSQNRLQNPLEGLGCCPNIQNSNHGCPTPVEGSRLPKNRVACWSWRRLPQAFRADREYLAVHE